MIITLVKHRVDINFRVLVLWKSCTSFQQKPHIWNSDKQSDYNEGLTRLKSIIVSGHNVTKLEASPDLVEGDAIRRVEVAEDVKLVEAGEGDEEEVPNHQHHAVLAVQLPAVGVGGHD